MASVFFLKKNSLRSDIFFWRKIQIPPRAELTTEGSRSAKREKATGKVLDIPELHVDRGVGVFFLVRKKMSEQSEFFFQKKKYPTPVSARKTSGYKRM
ncbi:hypothetical protein AU15_14645 [Marinobacter salarius]|uniref:Uncharacterized protein n=2 Tax=Marinobacter salarius TaxID=1420917 RepID=W5YW12_9GAMM|nr:hypothetical protein AU15_14645 [Marinobacter salarius]